MLVRKVQLEDKVFREQLEQLDKQHKVHKVLRVPVRKELLVHKEPMVLKVRLAQELREQPVDKVQRVVVHKVFKDL